MNSPIALRLSATWPERLFLLGDAALDLLERAARALAADKSGDFGPAAHATQVRRLAAHGCNGQALI